MSLPNKSLWMSIHNNNPPSLRQKHKGKANVYEAALQSPVHIEVFFTIGYIQHRTSPSVPTRCNPPKWDIRPMPWTIPQFVHINMNGSVGVHGGSGLTVQPLPWLNGPWWCVHGHGVKSRSKLIIVGLEGLEKKLCDHRHCASIRKMEG